MKKMRTTASWLNIRRKPGTDHEEIGSIPKGSEVERYADYLAPDGAVWSWISWGQLTGWVAKKYLEGSLAVPDPLTGLWVPRAEDIHWMTPRNGWGAVGGRGDVAKRDLKLVVVHHSAADYGVDVRSTAEAEKKVMRGIESFHVTKPPKGRGWNGIAYNFVIFPSGRVYVGRGWGHVGAHANGVNSKSVGVMFPQDGDKLDLTPQQIISFKLLIENGRKAHALSTGALTIDGHRNMPQETTHCPGNLIQKRLPELRAGI